MVYLASQDPTVSDLAIVCSSELGIPKYQGDSKVLLQILQSSIVLCWQLEVDRIPGVRVE